MANAGHKDVLMGMWNGVPAAENSFDGSPKSPVE